MNVDKNVYDTKEHKRRSSYPNSSNHTTVYRKDFTGRNDPCPCGSGKKYKKCCLAKGWLGRKWMVKS